MRKQVIIEPDEPGFEHSTDASLFEAVEAGEEEDEGEDGEAEAFLVDEGDRPLDDLIEAWRGERFAGFEDAGDERWSETFSENGSIPRRRPNEFACRACFLVKHRRLLADEERQICLDCV